MALISNMGQMGVGVGGIESKMDNCMHLPVLSGFWGK